MLIVCPNCATSYGVEMASLRLASGWTRKLRCQRCRWVWQAQLSDTDKLWSRRMQCRRYGAPWPLSPKLRPMRRERRCRACGEPRQFWLMTDRMPTRPAGSPAEPVGAKPARATVTPPSQRISAGGCPGHRRCQATVLVALVVALVAAILVAVLVTVLVTILATIVVAVAAVTVTFAVPYSQTCADRRGNCCRAYRCCLGHAANRVVLCHARFAGEP